ncbi:MAG: hypothetical protein U5L09_07745 [Bacteroidales bacterium]|nr:hypothetical protein [Bacteroidales bacterium]
MRFFIGAFSFYVEHFAGAKALVAHQYTRKDVIGVGTRIGGRIFFKRGCLFEL